MLGLSGDFIKLRVGVVFTDGKTCNDNGEKYPSTDISPT